MEGSRIPGSGSRSFLSKGLDSIVLLITRVRHDHAGVREYDGHRCTAPRYLPPGYERRPRETPMGIDTCHHIAGRHCIITVWHLWYHLSLIYGEENTIGRLLQEIVAQSGDITCQDWVGKSSEFSSCLPADITSYEAPLCILPPLFEEEIETLVFSLRNTVSMEIASQLYALLDRMSAPVSRTANCICPASYSVS
ncbi:hypothetical protein K503DRAFT_378605 [Rhizopogon vinicolor AM-OR11-026]|uniref:Uncharacterized protein n=1 Tax=Rhizopogon vinicolor AM-OR11-026 TaxID=1314800 RepID=A0A1B7MRM8_9AGAM|nr:hypothetical protein K503DRAFT_378605 [Rhizopogon vinicolor AM-OR11-026]